MSDRDESVRLSGGPKTDIGRARSSKNALRHGLRAASIVLPGFESTAEWQAHLTETIDALRPGTYLEKLLVERIAVQSWRLRRVALVEQAVAATAMYRLDMFGRDVAEEEAAKEAHARQGVELETRIMAHRTAAVPGEWMETLSRYETAIERSFFRTIAALRTERENAPLEGAVVDEEPSASVP